MLQTERRPTRCGERTNIQLYVHVFIMDDCGELMSEWLHFAKGVADSEDVPLNTSRDTLQQNKVLHVIQNNLVNKCFDIFAETKDDYKKFYEQFGKCLKLGVNEDSTNRTKVAELMCYHTSKSGDETISLKEYVDRMKDGPNDIYYSTGDCKQLKELDGKMIKSTTKTASKHDWSANMERNMKAQALRYYSMNSYMVSKKIVKVSPKHSHTSELTKMASADKSDKKLKAVIWLLSDTPLLTFGFILYEPTQFAGRIYCMLKLGLNSEDDNEGLGG